MLTTIMKYVAIAALLTGMFGLPANLRSYLDFVITAAAMFVLVQAVNFRKYAWAAIFGLVVCVFNPVRPIGFSFSVLVALHVISATLFAVSLAALRTTPRMTIASIVQTNPRTQSL